VVSWNDLGLWAMIEVESKVIEIIAKQANADRATLARATPLADLALESMDFVEIMFELEDAFDISIPYSANSPETGNTTYGTVGDVIDHVAILVGKSDCTAN
jgi:acyl carrier protein